MKIERLTDTLSVTAQIQLSDIGEIANAGFTQIIVNRPDDEGTDYPRHEIISEDAERHGLRVAYLPIAPAAVTNDAADKFRELCEAERGNTLAYCRTGMRSRALWKKGRSDKELSEKTFFSKLLGRFVR